MPNSPDTPARATYHHGELPETLIDLGVTQIRQFGIEKLSLRALAREAGVSPTAPYRHFPTRQCLLAAIATRGFHSLTARMKSALGESSDAHDQFVRFGKAYVDLAREDPVSYELMFGGVIDFERYPALFEAAETNFRQVIDVLRAHAGGASEDDLLVLAGTVWAGVHGIASLLISKLMAAPHTRPSLAVSAMRRLGSDPEAALHLLFDPIMGGSQNRNQKSRQTPVSLVRITVAEPSAHISKEPLCQR